MKKKAIIFDIDNTAVFAKPDALPSERLIKVVKRIITSSEYHISCATGRTYPWAVTVTNALELVDPCIVAAGTQIVNPINGAELWSKRLNIEDVKKALKAFKDLSLNPRILTETDSPDTAKTASELELKNYLLLDVQDIPPVIVEDVINEIKHSANVAVTKVNSPNVGYINLHITNEFATKEHAITELLKILQVDVDQTIGVGDGHNDLHLFAGVKIKVAMGNAVPELKAEADIVIGDVKDDGLAEYLESL